MNVLATPGDPMAKVAATAFIEEEIKEGLRELADDERRSMSQMIAVLIERAVIVHQETKAAKAK
ncbi:MAG: ribbon-helix-helix protein, CopG family [Acaryochloridaceae cyanobacterium RL_2_7]|nr:ribbon-helix-helix protein, CopG family [Acaryochloridaceae cyanobacterium RL_2_7]